METREAATIPARKLVPWTDRKGVRHWVEMEAGAAEELELFDRWARGRRKAFRKTHTLATDADAMRRPRPDRERHAAARIRLVGYLCYEMEPAARAQRLASGDGYPWEGPRPKFTLLMGESPTWDGPGAWFELREVEARGGPFVRKFYGDERGHGACRICGALGELPPYAVCLHCCRTGRDGEIGVGAPRTEPKRHRPGKLKGGMS